MYLFPVQRCSLYAMQGEPFSRVLRFIPNNQPSLKAELHFSTLLPGLNGKRTSLLPHVMQTHLENPCQSHLTPPTRIQPAPLGLLSLSGKAGRLF